MKTLYVLALQNNKYYVGITKNFHRRFREHQNGLGSQWTQRYPLRHLINREEINREYASFRETQKTFEFMLEYGLNNVRGAEYCLLENYRIEDVSFAIAHHLNMRHNEVKERLEYLEGYQQIPTLIQQQIQPIQPIQRFNWKSFFENYLRNQTLILRNQIFNIIRQDFQKIPLTRDYYIKTINDYNNFIKNRGYGFYLTNLEEINNPKLIENRVGFKGGFQILNTGLFFHRQFEEIPYSSYCIRFKQAKEFGMTELELDYFWLKLEEFNQKYFKHLTDKEHLFRVQKNKVL